MREIVANYALFIGCLLVYRRLYIVYLVMQWLLFGAPMTDFALVLIGVNSFMLSALTMLWFVNKIDQMLKK